MKCDTFANNKVGARHDYVVNVRDLLQIARHDTIGTDGRIKEPTYATMNLRWNVVENILNQVATIRPESTFSGTISMNNTQTMTYTDGDFNEDLYELHEILKR